MNEKIVIGSARKDENNNIKGGKKGDQKQTELVDYTGEVSFQKFYVHKKGWNVARPKTEELRHLLGSKMVNACSNSNIGYNQWERNGIYKYGTESTVKTNCDCSSLVTQCLRECGFVTFPNSRTIDLIENMKKYLSEYFEFFEYTEKEKLKIGDILCTKTSGHVVIVVGE